MDTDIEEAQKRWEKAYLKHSIGLFLTGGSASLELLGALYAARDNMIPKIMKHGLDYIKSYPVQTAFLFVPLVLIPIGAYLMFKDKDWNNKEIWEKHVEYEFQRFKEKYERGR